MTLRTVYRITVFVPPDHLDPLLDGIEAECPLLFGPYDHSAWWSAIGTEQFRPLTGAQPAVGTVGSLERVGSIRLEFAIPHDAELLDRVVTRGVLANHPWQEPAVFVDEALVTATRLRDNGV